MANIKQEIVSLRAKLARLEKAQKAAEEQEKAFAEAEGQIEKLFKESGLSLESYIRRNHKQISRIVGKIERENRKQPPTPKTSKKRAVAKKGKRRSKKPVRTVKIPAGKYGNLPASPEAIFEVKEKGPRPKLLKTYAEEVGLEAFLKQCRLDG